MSDHLPVAANFTVRRWGTNARTQANLLTHVLLYPNPNQSGIVRLSIPSTESIESLTLFNTIGQAVMTVPNPQQTHVAETYTELDIMALPAGIYSIQVVTASGKTGVARLVKQ
jgi:hypothetical protein